MRRLLALCLVATAGVAFVAAESSGQTPGNGTCINHQSFNDSSGLSMGGSATTTGGVLRLTPAEGGHAGSAFSTTPLNLTDNRGLDTTFQFRITEPGGIQDDDGATGADGLAMVFVNSPNAPTGSVGSGIGYGGIPNSVAIEFDTFANKGSAPGAEVNDPNGNHVGVHTNGQEPNSQNETAARAVNANVPNMSDGAAHTVRVLYQPPGSGFPGLRVYLDNMTTPVIEMPSFDMANTINLNNGQGFLGFTASTGSAWENHDILSWTACAGPPTATPPTSSTTAPGTATTTSSSTTTTVAGSATTTSTTAVAQPTSPPLCPATTTGTVSPNAVLPGDVVTYTDNSGCFAPNATLTVVYTSQPVALGTVQADAAGRVVAQIRIPTTTVNGPHTLTLTGAGRSRPSHTSSGTLTVTRTGVLSVTGGGSGLTPWGAALVAAGGLLLLAAWRHGRREELREWGFLPSK